MDKFCSDCGAWSCLGAKFSRKCTVHKYFSFEYLCTVCFDKRKAEYDSRVLEINLKKQKEKEALFKDRGSIRKSIKYKSLLDFPIEKKCSKCEFIKSIENFQYQARKTAMGQTSYTIHGWCKECQNEYIKAHRRNMSEEEKEEYKNYQAQYYKDNKEKIVEYHKRYSANNKQVLGIYQYLNLLYKKE